MYAWQSPNRMGDNCQHCPRLPSVTRPVEEAGQGRVSSDAWAYDGRMTGEIVRNPREEWRTPQPEGLVSRVGSKGPSIVARVPLGFLPGTKQNGLHRYKRTRH